MTVWSTCPECRAPAEVLDDWTDVTDWPPRRHVTTRCPLGHVLTTHDGRTDFVPPAPHEPECSACGHAVHLLRCEAPIDDDDGVPCPCRRIPVPGVYP